MRESANIMLDGMMRYEFMLHVNYIYAGASCRFFNSVFSLMQVTAEDMEAYRMKKIHHDDPMKNFLH